MNTNLQLQNLKPFKDNHSISEVILSVYLASPIINPARYAELVKENKPLSDRFQNFNLLEGKQMQVSNTQSGMQPEISNTGKDGFNISSYKDGKLTWRIQYQPSPLPQAQDLLSIHCLDYDSWNVFLNESLRLIKILSDFEDLFIAGYSLYYLDQFNWSGAKLPDMNIIFNPQSEYLPKLLFETKGIWNFVSNTSRDIEGRLITETTQIGTNLIEINKYNIYLFHHAASMFNEYKSLKQLLGEAEFKTLADKMHDLNKDFLKQTLDIEIQRIIALQ